MNTDIHAIYLDLGDTFRIIKKENEFSGRVCRPESGAGGYSTHGEKALLYNDRHSIRFG